MIQPSLNQLTLNFSPPKLSQQELYEKFLSEHRNSKRDTQLILILDLMKDCKPHTSLEVYKHTGSLNAHRRFSDLREFGFNISHAIKAKHNWYIWFSENQTIDDEKTRQDILNAEKKLGDFNVN